MKAAPGVDDWAVAPVQDGVTIQQHVINHVMGILRMYHPAPRGSLQVCDPKVIEQHGPRLFEFMNNIVEEVERSGKTATIAIRWVNGVPDLKVIRRLIIDPMVN